MGDNSGLKLIVVWGMMLLMFSMIFSVLEKEKTPEFVENGYEIYLDGEPVDLDVIDINQYDVTIDHEKECIFLTKPENNRIMFLPMFLGR